MNVEREESAESPSDDSSTADFGYGGLCPRCKHVRRLQSERGSVFLLCRLAQTRADIPKYPPQPVLACPGFEE